MTSAILPGVDPVAAAQVPSRASWWRRFSRRPPAVIGLVGVAVVVAMAVFAPLLAHYSPTTSQFGHVLAYPFSAGHLLGTDELGRDELSRIIYGSQATLEVGVLATLLAMALAVPIGIASGYYRGAVDMVAMRIADVLLAFPFLLLAVGLAAIFGPSLQNIVLALGIAQVPGAVRIARAEAMALREQDFIQAAIVTGVKDRVIIFRHLFPNMLSPLMVQASVSIPGAILGSALLSYLGLGVQPPTPSWGTMLASAQTYLYNDPWLAIFPGVAIFLTTLAFNLLGDGLRDLFDPSLR
ncbi:MAG TPA: ABC transporter permease [Candidatus Nanopelagicaceae bacterium]|nr:ABC transporter permease [Candidatus Nanopelagicaceae bacterium]